jgi:ATP-dependent Lon protease
MTMLEKLKNCFGEMVVYKDLKKSNFFSALSLPSFMRDWLLKRFENEDGEFDQTELAEFIKTYIPRREDWTALKNRIVVENERVKFLAKISVDIDVGTGGISFSLPDFGVPNRETLIETHIWDVCKQHLVKGRETWGMLELGYRPPDVGERGKIKLLAFKNFCPYTIEPDYYKDARKEFSTNEWIDLLLGAVDYNAAGFTDEQAKLTMLTRILPFVEKRLNLIELAPKGTGKSYLFGRISRFGWLSSGGVMSRAKLFYDISKRTEGLVAGNDFVTLDEVQTITFADVDEVRAALKGYMENGIFTVGNYQGVADAGIILCGNIRSENMDEYVNMFEDLPSEFHESALIDRFHGFIKGWHIPRMNDDLKISGWALNSEYFTSILHELRSDVSYRAVVDDLVNVPAAADTRDVEAIKRIATAYLKLLFPNARMVSDIDAMVFNRYCLRPARQMRGIIKTQLGILDPEFKGKDVPAFSVRGAE